MSDIHAAATNGSAQPAPEQDDGFDIGFDIGFAQGWRTAVDALKATGMISPAQARRLAGYHKPRKTRLSDASS